MKRKTASQLAKLLKAKTQLERFHFEQIKKSHTSAMNAASALHHEAIGKSTINLAGDNATAYQAQEKRISHLLSNANAEEQRADDMLDLLAENHQKVKAALQRELALKEMSKRLEVDYRKMRNKKEESQHEQVRSIQKSSN